tara:strand:+ start:8321 stop:8644 length:324 start_codon:yes stop_codon:yes gene_type:complete
MNSLSKQWDALLLKLQNEVDEDIDLKGILFLIGVQELQKGIKSFTKEEKQDLLHIATCRLLSSYGYFKFNKIDEDGWPHWIELKPIKNLTGKQQDLLIKEAIINYFN